MAIFGATASKNPQVFQAGKAVAVISDMPAMLLGVTIQITRQLNPIPTLTDGIVWSAQPVQGTLSAQSILVNGRSKELLDILTNTNICKPISCSVTLADHACAASGIVLTINDGYCSSVTFTASGSQGYIGNDFTLQFTSAEIQNSSGYQGPSSDA